MVYLFFFAFVVRAAMNIIVFKDSFYFRFLEIQLLSQNYKHFFGEIFFVLIDYKNHLGLL